MSKKRKTLPDNFQELIKSGNIEELKKVYETCEINAYKKYDKTTAMFIENIPDELVKWLVEQGADIEFRDSYGNTALHRQAAYGGNVKLLIELGADISARNSSNETPLHEAAWSFQAQTVRELINMGADVNAAGGYDWNPVTPLESVLQRCLNYDIPKTLETAKVFIDKNTPVTDKMRTFVTKIGERFEFSKDSFNEEYLQETEDALHELYKLFGVEPVAEKRKHNGIDEITVKSKTWQEQHNELWKYLVPGSGHAQTVQGEVIRISGKVSYEILDNGGINWDSDYRKMLKSLLEHLSSGNALTKKEHDKVAEAISTLNNGVCENETDIYNVSELSVKWVLNNPKPVKLKTPSYRR